MADYIERIKQENQTKEELEQKKKNDFFKVNQVNAKMNFDKSHAIKDMYKNHVDMERKQYSPIRQDNFMNNRASSIPAVVAGAIGNT